MALLSDPEETIGGGGGGAGRRQHNASPGLVRVTPICLLKVLVRELA